MTLYEQIMCVAGWVEPQLFPIVRTINYAQKDLVGNVAEIGVFHGKFFMTLALCLRDGEYAFAVDIFERQSENVSSSGKGSFAHFAENVATIVPEASICVLKENSLKLKNNHAIFTFNGLKVRLFSVDGGHDYHEAKNDLAIADAVLHDKGVIIVDDFQHVGWYSVFAATMDFLAATDYVPFAMGGNKLFLCKPPAVEMYKDLNGITTEEYFEPIVDNRTVNKAKAIIRKYPNVVLFPEQIHFDEWIEPIPGKN